MNEFITYEDKNEEIKIDTEQKELNHSNKNNNISKRSKKIISNKNK